jgi:hypothetical protein
MPCTFGFGKASRNWTLAKLKKCEFYQFKVEFLGYIIFGDDIGMDPRKVQIINDWPILVFVRNV